MKEAASTSVSFAVIHPNPIYSPDASHLPKLLSTSSIQLVVPTAFSEMSAQSCSDHLLAFHQTGELQSGLGRLLPGLQQAGIRLLAMAKACGFPRAESYNRAPPAHLPGLCSCSWSLALHITSHQKEENLILTSPPITGTTPGWPSLPSSTSKGKLKWKFFDE